jgi:hypothetical protein
LILKTYNSPVRIGLYGFGVFGFGAVTAPLLAALNSFNPFIIPVSIFLSASMTFGAPIYSKFN